MGLQKAAKKYGMGVARIRKIEAENGMGRELVPAEPFPTKEEISSGTPISPEDMRRHFQEVQDSFAIALEEIQKTKKKAGGKDRPAVEGRGAGRRYGRGIGTVGRKNRHPNRPAVGVHRRGCVGIWLLSIHFPTPTKTRDTLCTRADKGAA